MLAKKKCDVLADSIQSLISTYEFDRVAMSGRIVGQKYFIEKISSELMVFSTLGALILILVLGFFQIWAHRAIDAAVAELRRVEESMTRFDPGSDVGRLNAAASRWVPVSEDTGTVLREAQRWASISDGRFDPAMGHAARLWDVSERSEPPEPGTVGRFAH